MRQNDGMRNATRSRRYGSPFLAALFPALHSVRTATGCLLATALDGKVPAPQLFKQFRTICRVGRFAAYFIILLSHFLAEKAGNNAAQKSENGPLLHTNTCLI
jgi:hypothetical protein